MKEIYEKPKVEEIDLEETFSFGMASSKSLKLIDFCVNNIKTISRKGIADERNLRNTKGRRS